MEAIGSMFFFFLMVGPTLGRNMEVLFLFLTGRDTRRVASLTISVSVPDFLIEILQDERFFQVKVIDVM